jgi:DNA replication and repair protein RecF
MSVILEELRLCNFRNHTSFSLKNPERIVIIIGHNAAGKTNIIEAIQLVSMMESFRNPRWQTVVTNGEENAAIQASFLQEGRLLDIQLNIQGGKRFYSCNDKNKKQNMIKGLIPAVLFIPDDLSLVKGSAEARRGLLDNLGQQLSSTYLKILTDYHKIVRQRTLILKEQRQAPSYSLVQESWDENLIHTGALLFTHRVRLYKRLLDKARVLYQEISSSEDFTSNYNPSFHRLGVEYSDDELLALDKTEVEGYLRQTAEIVRSEEWARAKSLVGPHRDEIIFFINGCEARQFASQGQQRSITLALKLAELALIQEIKERQPLLLLDDVMSELDENRRDALIKVLDGRTQTFITATDLSCFDERLLKNAQIIDLDARNFGAAPSEVLQERQTRQEAGE